MQSSTVGHEIPVRAGAEASGNGWATQVAPPLTVASMTVAGAGGVAGADEVVVEPVAAGAAAGSPGVPTAQQWPRPAQATALSWPVPVGAGCPTTAGVPDR
jgi:hypothetical protein